MDGFGLLVYVLVSWCWLGFVGDCWGLMCVGDWCGCLGFVRVHWGFVGVFRVGILCGLLEYVAVFFHWMLWFVRVCRGLLMFVGVCWCCLGVVVVCLGFGVCGGFVVFR